MKITKNYLRQLIRENFSQYGLDRPEEETPEEAEDTRKFNIARGATPTGQDADLEKIKSIVSRLDKARIKMLINYLVGLSK